MMDLENLYVSSRTPLCFNDPGMARNVNRDTGQQIEEKTIGNPPVVEVEDQESDAYLAWNARTFEHPLLWEYRQPQEVVERRYSGLDPVSTAEATEIQPHLSTYDNSQWLNAYCSEGLQSSSSTWLGSYRPGIWQNPSSRFGSYVEQAQERDWRFQCPPTMHHHQTLPFKSSLSLHPATANAPMEVVPSFPKSPRSAWHSFANSDVSSETIASSAGDIDQIDDTIVAGSSPIASHPLYGMVDQHLTNQQYNAQVMRAALLGPDCIPHEPSPRHLHIPGDSSPIGADLNQQISLLPVDGSIDPNIISKEYNTQTRHAIPPRTICPVGGDEYNARIAPKNPPLSQESAGLDPSLISAKAYQKMLQSSHPDPHPYPEIDPRLSSGEFNKEMDRHFRSLRRDPPLPTPVPHRDILPQPDTAPSQPVRSFPAPPLPPQDRNLYSTSHPPADLGPHPALACRSIGGGMHSWLIEQGEACRYNDNGKARKKTTVVARKRRTKERNTHDLMTALSTITSVPEGHS